MICTQQLDDVGEKIGPIVTPRDHFVQGFVQYPTAGTGTLQLQGTLNDLEYEVIAVIPAAGGAAVTDIITGGIYSADVSGYSRVQLIMTVDGDCTASLSLPAV
jgi:hypothetical protein